jgi:hypothetical protein
MGQAKFPDLAGNSCKCFEKCERLNLNSNFRVCALMMRERNNDTDFNDKIVAGPRGFEPRTPGFSRFFKEAFRGPVL